MPYHDRAAVAVINYTLSNQDINKSHLELLGNFDYHASNVARREKIINATLPSLQNRNARICKNSIEVLCKFYRSNTSDPLIESVLGKLRPLCTHEINLIRETAQDAFDLWSNIPNKPQESSRRKMRFNK